MPRPQPNQRCPLCKKPSDTRFNPFCSQGCKDRDLLQWLGEGYKIPGHPADPDYPSDPFEKD